MRAKKHLGQHFLKDLFVLSEITCSIAPRKGDSIIEIGPGYGALTKMLLPLVTEMSVIEIDTDCVSTLEQLGNLTIYNEDVLKFDWQKISSNTRVVGNLPYNIATEIFFKCFKGSDQISDMHFMMQKEVANRILASHGSKSYGKLSVMMQVRAQIEHLFDIVPEAFEPRPKVTSSFCRIIPNKEQMPTIKLKLLEDIVSAAFSRRRKQCHHNLKRWFSKSDLENLGIKPDLRAEDISIESYKQMVDSLV